MVEQLISDESNNAMSPAGDIALGVDPSGEARKIGWAVEAMPRGILPRPQQLNRRPLHCLGDLNGLSDEISFQSTSKPSSNLGWVKLAFLDW